MLPENFQDHPTFEKLDQLQQVLTSDEGKEKIPLQEAAYFEAVYKYLKDRLKHTLPILVQETEMNALLNEVDSITVQINAFLGNNNIGHISNATNNCYSVLNRIRNFPLPFSKGDYDFSKSISSFEQTSVTAYKNLETLKNNLQNELTATQSDLVVKQQQITNLESKIATKEVEIQNVLARLNTEYESLKTTINSSAENDRKQFSENNESDRKLLKDEFDSAIENNKETFEILKNNLEEESEKVVENLNAKLAEANKIVNIVGNVGVTGNYQNIANQNRSNANFWRWVAVFFMILMSGLLIWSIIELGNADFNLYKSLVRIIAAAVLTYPAIYAARESTKHRNLETKNRNIELELASIGPFIELLPEDKKQKIKEELVAKYFGNHEIISTTSKDDEEVPISVFEKILKAVLPIIKK